MVWRLVERLGHGTEGIVMSGVLGALTGVGRASAAFARARIALSSTGGGSEIADEGLAVRGGAG